MKPVTYARPVYSPLSLAMADRCLQSWILRYVHGVKTPESVTRSKVLGVLIHKCLEIYARGDRSMLTLSRGDFEQKELDAFSLFGEREGGEALDALFDEAPQRSLPAVGFIPTPDTPGLTLLQEQPLAVACGFEVSDWSRIDLELYDGTRGEVAFVDYKSTRGKPGNPWAYVPSPDSLKHDIQFLLYALGMMQKYQRSSVEGRFIYCFTGKGPPQATAVDVEITHDEAAANLAPWQELAKRLTQIIRDTHVSGKLPDPAAFAYSDKLHTSESPCRAFGGCPYEHQHCTPPLISPEQVIARTRKDNEMPLEDRLAQQNANGAPVLPGSAPMTPSRIPFPINAGKPVNVEAVVVPATLEPDAVETSTETEPYPVVEEPRRGRPRPAKGTKAKASPVASEGAEALAEKVVANDEMPEHLRYVGRAAQTVDSAIETLAQRARDIGCDIEVNVKLKGSVNS